MMTTPTIERLWSDAIEALRLGHLRRAIETLRRILSLDPQFGDAHALLAFCLADMKRLGAAETEAGIALALDASSELAHRAMAHVCTARRKFAEAEGHYQRLLEMRPEDASHHREYGELLSLMGRNEEAERELTKALEINPEDPSNHTSLGVLQLANGKIAEAEPLAEQALSLSPRHLEGLVLMGRVALRKGDIDRAREHAHWALRIDATHRGALTLMAAIKAQTNWFLGLWWRYSTWIMETGSRRAVLVLLGAFVLYRVIRQLLLDAGNGQGAELLTFAWLGVCIYTWVGPRLFQRELEKELGEVRLRGDF